MRVRAMFFAAALALALLASVPLRVAVDWLMLDRYGLAAREADGSLWLGALREAQLGGTALGDVAVRLRLLPLLAGRARLDLARSGELQGAAIVGRRGFGFEDVTGSLDVRGALAPLPAETLELSDVTFRFADGACARAEGMVRVRLGGALAGFALPPAMSGAARCEGGALLLPLAGQAGREAIHVRIRDSGRYQADLIVTPADEAAGARLAAAGFRPVGGGYALRLEGEL